MKTVNQLIIDYLSKKDMRQAQLARMMNDTPQNIGKKIKAKNISILFLEELSDILQHNFFEELSAEWKRKHFSVTNFIEEPNVKYGSPTSFDKYLELIIEKKVAEKLKK